jgi:glutathione S-transferase
MRAKMEREEKRVERTIAYAENMCKGNEFLVGNRFSLADLVLGVALQYVDFRYAHDWRSSAPKLTAWHKGIAARPSFVDTQPPDFTPPQ